VIVDSEARFAEAVPRLTQGEGVHVVYDGSGPTTFQGSLDTLRRSGTLCWYGPERLRAFGASIRLDRARQAQGPVRGRVLTGGDGEGPCRHGKTQDHR
jgi:NADPH:quinone reductase-like Zn-dependent oxidoreductase